MISVQTPARTFYKWLFNPSTRIQHNVLGTTAVLSSLIYWWTFARTFNLLHLYDRPLLNLRDLSRDNPATRWELLLAFLALGLLYWLGWRASLKAKGRLAWAIVLSGPLLSGLALLFMYPFGAADLFDNVIHGRILGVYGANPFLDVARDFAHDPFYPYVAWKRTPSAYGPLWEIMAGGVAWLAGNGIVANVLAFKLLPGLFLAGSVVVLALILRQVAPHRMLPGVLLLAWNPVILYMTLGNGHNDVAMAFWILVAVWGVVNGRFTTAILALMVGTLFKFMPVLLLPAAGLIALRQLPHWSARIRFVLVTGTAVMAMVTLAYAPFWFGWETLGADRRTHLITASLPAFIWALSDGHLESQTTLAIIGRAAAVLTILMALWQGVRAWQDISWRSFPQAAFNVLAFYLLVTCLWFQEWYTVWLLVIAPLLSPGHSARLAALFGIVALTKPLLFVPALLWIDPFPPKPWRELRLGPAVMALPWLYALFALGQMWYSRFKEKYSEEHATF